MRKKILVFITLLTIMFSCKDRQKESIIQSNQFLKKYKIELFSNLSERYKYEKLKVSYYYINYINYKNSSDNLVKIIRETPSIYINGKLDKAINNYLETLQKTLSPSDTYIEFNKSAKELLVIKSNILKEELINRILTIDVSVLNEILKTIDLYDFKFDIVQANVYSDNPIIILGDSLEINFGLLANNTEYPNRVIIGKLNKNHELIEAYDTIGNGLVFNNYKFLPVGRGRHELQGILQVFQGKNQHNYSFQYTYNVK